MKNMVKKILVGEGEVNSFFLRVLQKKMLFEIYMVGKSFDFDPKIFDFGVNFF